MAVAFAPTKDVANIAKHGVSLARAGELQIEARVVDGRFASELRLRAYGMLDGFPHRLAYTLREGVVRAISLRRAHLKEYRLHVR